MKTWIKSITTVFFILPVILSAQQSNVYQDGETLYYKVSWSLLRLGTIRISCHLDSSRGDRYKLKMLVKSNPYLPFINIEEMNMSIVDIADGMSRSFYGLHRNGDEEVEIECIYADKTREATFSVREAKSGNYNRFEILRRVDPYLDGPSLFFYSRTHIHSNRVYRIPTLIDGKMETTVLDFTGPSEWIEVEAFDYPVRARLYTGTADWQGGTSAGLNGEFKGWVSDDDEAITLKAEMKVLLGSITIELEEYKRTKWLPPVWSEKN